MVKHFHLAIPKKEKSITPSEVVNPDKVKIKSRTINIKYKHTPSNNPPYRDTTPNSEMWKELVTRYNNNPPIEHWQYVEHRQMDIGRAIALDIHPRRKFIKSSDSLYTFTEYTPERIDNPKYDPNWFTLPWGERTIASKKRIQSYVTKQYTVEWNGLLPLPSPDASSSSFTGIDSYIWAVYFLNNEIPDNNQWFPTPEKYPEWNSLNIGQPIPDYDLTL